MISQNNWIHCGILTTCIAAATAGSVRKRPGWEILRLMLVGIHTICVEAFPLRFLASKNSLVLLPPGQVLPPLRDSAGRRGLTAVEEAFLCTLFPFGHRSVLW